MCKMMMSSVNVRLLSFTLMTLILLRVDIVHSNTGGNVDAYEVLSAILFKTNAVHSLEESDKRIVQFWIEAGEVVDETKCTLSYMIELRRRIEMDMKLSKMANIKELYYYAELDVLSSCGDLVAMRELESRLFMGDAMDLLEIVGNEFNDWMHKTQDPEESFGYMAEWMLQIVGVDKRNDYQDFIDAWKQGPCAKLLARLREPDMRQLEKFVMMIDETKFDPMKLVSDVSGLHVAVIQCCEHLQEEDVLIEVWGKLQDNDPCVRLQVRLEAIIDGYDSGDDDLRDDDR